MEAIILAGGLGTRLRSEVSDLPKSMAPILGRPFLETLIDYLIAHGVKRIILSVGYKSESIQEHFKDTYKNCEIVYSKEETQLGTGGGIALAMKLAKNEHVIVANGDSLFLADIDGLYKSHIETNAAISLALKPMKNFSRYGTVKLNSQNRITSFEEKQHQAEGIINGGFYMFKVKTFLALDMPEKYSLEKEIFEAKVEQLYINGFITDGYFIDIGIPQDYKKAQVDIGCFLRADKTWTLFLDRDGVLNKKIDDDYVRSLSQFEILPGVIEAIASFSKVFGKILVVTNQQGVGKGLMSIDHVTEVHDVLQEKVEEAGGKIDKIYFAPQLVSENSEMRKPNIGMAHKAKKDFPEIDFSKSIMVGDSLSDMEFGKRAGMINVFVTDNNQQEEYYTVRSLAQFASQLQRLQKSFSG